MLVLGLKHVLISEFLYYILYVYVSVKFSSYQFKICLTVFVGSDVFYFKFYSFNLKTQTKGQVKNIYTYVRV